MSTDREASDDEQTSQLLAMHERLRAWRAELTADQTAAMDSLATAVRAGEVSEEDAAEIEGVIRRGHVHGARKRLSQARRRQASS